LFDSLKISSPSITFPFLFDGFSFLAGFSLLSEFDSEPDDSEEDSFFFFCFFLITFSLEDSDSDFDSEDELLSFPFFFFCGSGFFYAFTY